MGRRESNYLPIYKYLLRIQSPYFSGYPQKYPHIFKITALPFTTKKVKDLTPPLPLLSLVSGYHRSGFRSCLVGHPGWPDALQGANADWDGHVVLPEVVEIRFWQYVKIAIVNR